MYVAEGKNNKCTYILCATLLHIFPYFTTSSTLLRDTYIKNYLRLPSVNFWLLPMHIHSFAWNFRVFWDICMQNRTSFSIFLHFFNVNILNFSKNFQFFKIYFDFWGKNRNILEHMKYFSQKSLKLGGYPATHRFHHIRRVNTPGVAPSIYERRNSACQTP